MFESITISTQGSPRPIVDAGTLAECLLFYQKTTVVVAAEGFKTLVRTCGAEELLELCDMGNLEIEYLDNLIGIASIETNVGQCHDSVRMASSAIRLPQVARKVAEEEAGGSGRKANKLFDRFNKIVQRTEYDEEITSGSKEDLLNEEYLCTAVGEILTILAPEYTPPNPITFHPLRIPNFGIKYETNLDFAEINKSFHQKVQPRDASISPAYILAQITGATPDIIIASRNATEFAVDPIKSAIVRNRFSELLKKASPSKEIFALFQEFVINKSRSIREVVNSDDRSFADVIKLVQDAEKFKVWLKASDDENDIRANYCREVSSLDWAEKLPEKSIRFLIMTGAAAVLGAIAAPEIGIASGIALNAADYFLIDRLIKGWKPNQFIEGALKDFLNPK
jgi:hypothetical protein